MSKLKQMIKNEFEKDKGLATKVAIKMGHKNPSTLNKFVNTPERELESFSSLLVLVRELFPERELELMDEYVRTLNPKKNAARMSLEYTHINKLNEAHEFLLESMINCSNADSKELAKIYQVDLDVVNGKMKPLEAIYLLSEMGANTNPGKTYIAICKYYNYYDLSLIDAMQTLKSVIETNLDNIEDEFLKKSYTNRYISMTIDIDLHNDKIEEVRKHIKTVEECDSNYVKSNIYLMIGNSYIFESYEKGFEYMKKALAIAEKYNYTNRIAQAQSSINFIQNYWNKLPMFIDESREDISNKHELAFFYIGKNDQKGLEILYSINKDELTDLQMGFHFFYKGLALKSKEFFLKSVKHFCKSGEKYYKHISLIELKKLGMDDSIIEAFAF